MPLDRQEALDITAAFLIDYRGADVLGYRYRATAEELWQGAAVQIPPGVKGAYVPALINFNGRVLQGCVDAPLNNLDDGFDLLKTLRHEVLGHFGINTFAPLHKRALLDAIVDAQASPTLKPLWQDIHSAYSTQSILMKAEEVFALAAEQVAPSDHPQPRLSEIRGAKAFRQVCVERTKLMDIGDLRDIVVAVASGIATRTREQQTFPGRPDQQFRQQEKAMDAKKPFHEVVADKLIEQLKAGTSPLQKPWQPSQGEGGGILPTNPVTGKRYRGANAVWLMAQERSDNRWMTYKQAESLGAQVRKGEHGTLVEYWKSSEDLVKRDDNGKPVLDANGNAVKVRVELERPHAFRAVVFNAEQIDGLPQRRSTVIPKWEAIERAEKILQQSEATIQHQGNRAFYRPSTDSITLPERGQFPEAAGYYATALHELGHWTGHKSRLDRDLAHPFGSEGYAKEELRAEIASMLLGQELGIGHDPGQHVAYVGSWIKTLEDDPKELFRAAADAEKILGYVMALEQRQVQDHNQQQEASVKQIANSPGDDQVAQLLSVYPADTARAIEHLANMRADLSKGAIESAVFERASRDAVGVAIPEDWSGLFSVVALSKQGGGLVHAPEGIEPDSFAVYAHTLTESKAIAVVPTQRDALVLADKLRLVDALTEREDLDRAYKLALVYEARLRDDPNSSGEEISEAKDARKMADWLATTAREEREAAQNAAGAARGQGDDGKRERQFINVPFAEKDEAKALGARWDRNQQSWYVPAGADAAPFAKWSAPNPPSEKAQQGHQRPAEAANEPRQYLAVPYAQRDAARAAGARWDKAAKSWFAGADADLTKLAQWLPERVATVGALSPAMSPRDEFAQAMRDAGLFVGSNAQGDHPIMDGQRHRVPVDGGKKGAVDGFYVGHLDGHPAGRIINNKTGVDVKWKSKGYALSDDERAKLNAEAASKLAARAAELERQHESTAQRVAQQMSDLVPAIAATPYLAAKGLEPQLGVMTDREGQKTYLPAIDADGKQWTMQYIGEDGTKRFAKDSRKEGCFHAVGGMDALAAAPVLVIAEGYATAAQIAKALEHATVAAFDSGNLEAVAKALHAKFPDKPIIIAGDDDRHLLMTLGHNPGREKAQAAAAAVGGRAIFPTFAPDEAAYPKHLPEITPTIYRAHLQAAQQLADANLQQASLSIADRERLNRAVLGLPQTEALGAMKRFTDFNDLAQHSVLGEAAAVNQLRAAVKVALRPSPEPEEQQVQKREQRPAVENRPRRSARVG